MIRFLALCLSLGFVAGCEPRTDVQSQEEVNRQAANPADVSDGTDKPLKDTHPLRESGLTYESFRIDELALVFRRIELAHDIDGVSELFMSETEVTNSMYQQFIDDSGAT